RPVILGSLVVWSAATLATGFVGSFEAMLAARAVMGVSESFYIPAAVALIVEYHRGPTRSRATGLHLSGAYAGSVLGGLGGWLAESFGWRFGFHLSGAVGVAYALVLAALLKEPKAHPLQRAGLETPAFGPTFAALMSTRGFQLLLGVTACVGAGF